MLRLFAKSLRVAQNVSPTQQEERSPPRGARFDHMADRREEDAYRDNQIFRGLVDTGGIRAS
jgi:hypothetical protein